MSKKQLFTIEFPVRCSPGILFEFLSTPAGLQEWFADKVDEWDGEFSFSWGGGVPDKAQVIEKEQDKFIKYQWLHSEKNEIKDQSQLWDYQVKELFHRLGA